MAEPRPKIVVCEHYADTALARLRTIGEVVHLESPGEDELVAALADAEALLIRTYTQVGERVLDSAPRLRVVGRGGVGVENINVAAAAARGIPVVHTPAAATEAVAELTIGLMLALERKILTGDARVRAQQFAAARRAAVGRELGQCTLGIIGMGRIGQAVSRIATAGFGMRVVYNDIIEVGPLDFPAEPMPKAQVYAAADIVTLHVTLTSLTRGMIDARALAHFRPATTLIDTARGAILDAEAVSAALHEGRLAGAAIDVFEPEPPPKGHPLLTAPNVILSPHAGARSFRGQERMNQVVEDVIAVLQHRPPRYPVTPA
ncbi:MAG: 3-phosphoglycerate dehydrogenase [Phycisphaerae bacterium]|nr:3-phosphoglycerate dehydrogenase [Phycisphaerae bacterium]